MMVITRGDKMQTENESFISTLNKQIHFYV
jgi:hypothetical protein